MNINHIMLVSKLSLHTKLNYEKARATLHHQVKHKRLKYENLYFSFKHI